MFFTKSPWVYKDLKKVNAKTGHCSFEKLKTALTAARKWEPSFNESLGLILKKCKICTHHKDIIDTEVTRSMMSCRWKP